MSARITLQGVKIKARLGVTPEERGEAQTCEGDLTFWLDLGPAAATDSLEQSVDYCRVLEIVEQTAMVREYNLLESLASAIVSNILHSFPVSRVGLRLRKRPEALLGKLDYVEVEMEGS